MSAYAMHTHALTPTSTLTDTHPHTYPHTRHQVLHIEDYGTSGIMLSYTIDTHIDK